MMTFGAANFQQITGQAMGVSQNAVRESIISVCCALIRLKPEVVKMPTVAEMDKTADAMYQRYGLEDFAFAVDGCIMSAFHEIYRTF